MKQGDHQDQRQNLLTLIRVMMTFYAKFQSVCFESLHD